MIPVSPRAADQDLLGVGQVELFTEDRLGPEGDLQELAEWSCGSVAQIRAEQSCAAEGAVLQHPGAHEALCLTLERGQWHVESYGELGGGVLVLAGEGGARRARLFDVGAGRSA